MLSLMLKILDWQKHNVKKSGIGDKTRRKPELEKKLKQPFSKGIFKFMNDG